MATKPKADDEKPPAPHLTVGRRGEDLAAKHLKAKGYKLLGRNFRTRFGEIDLIFQDCQTLVFVEVKTRTSTTYGPAGDAVNLEKIRRMSRAATVYLTEKKCLDQSARIDIVEVDFHGPTPQVTHWADALDLRPE